MRFRGRTHRQVDPKGRLMLPPEFRDAVLAGAGGEGGAQDHEPAVVLTTYDGCLVGYPLEDWREMEEKFSRLKNPSRQLRNFRRMVIGGAETVPLDKQGRLRLSPEHRDYAGIEKSVVLVGQVRTFEVWDKARFERQVLAQDMDDVAEELAESGIDFFL